MAAESNARGTIQLRVRLYAELARKLPGGGRAQLIELPAGSTVASLLAALDLASTEGLIVGRNGALASRATPLADGDEIEIMTAMQGGA